MHGGGEGLLPAESCVLSPLFSCQFRRAVLAFLTAWPGRFIFAKNFVEAFVGLGLQADQFGPSPPSPPASMHGGGEGLIIIEGSKKKSAQMAQGVLPSVCLSFLLEAI